MAIPYQLDGKRVFVAGHRGMVGAAVTRRLAAEPVEVLTAGREALDLTDQRAVRDWFFANRPDVVVLAAARVGGIMANATRPAEFIRDNLAIQTNVIHSAWESGVEKLLFLGSTCIYPREAPQPIREESLLAGPLEPTNEAYAVAKIAGIKMCQAYRAQYGADFISAQPTNLYGPGDNYDPEGSHVLPALIRKFHEARQSGARTVTLWGTGAPLREFLHVDDLADALVFLLRRWSDPLPINVGSGEEVSIRELAQIVAEAVGCTAQPVFDASRPDGTPRKLTDCSRLRALGWNNARPLRQGVADAYRAFLAETAAGAARGA
ncbi:GDP-L-fucose synthase family protein [Oceanicella actignis]|uniref:GDP-L-fucose synthase family protein n=1 Tax=Oceanicella actignis TaxID=1189325 RepID=UPI0011E6C3E4|nr:GDP-L-fucose synthase [Oceanicella actignis]TYO88775.1 GDP-L-fucose synthase [Oceanicella actignis]